MKLRASISVQLSPNAPPDKVLLTVHERANVLRVAKGLGYESPSEMLRVILRKAGAVRGDLYAGARKAADSVEMGLGPWMREMILAAMPLLRTSKDTLLRRQKDRALKAL